MRKNGVIIFSQEHGRKAEIYPLGFCYDVRFFQFLRLSSRGQKKVKNKISGTKGTSGADGSECFTVNAAAAGCLELFSQIHQAAYE